MLPLLLQVEAVANTPALWAEVLHSCMGLIGGEDGDLLAIRTFGCGDDLVLCREDDSVRMANQGERSRAGVALLPTGGVVVRFFPVQDDEGGTSFHRHHGEVRRGSAWWRSHVGLARLVLGEVVEGGGDGARLVRFLARLVDDMRG